MLTHSHHDFRRNLSCIGCGQPRGPPSPHLRRSQSPRPVASPRFVSSGPTFPSSSPPPQTLSSFPYSHPSPHATELHTTKPLGVSHPLLTPSGRAFSSGGKVQNVSSDPLAPCVMYWPDNEPLPEQGQIRPSGLTGVPVSRATVSPNGTMQLTRFIGALATSHIKYRESRTHRTSTW